MTFSNARLAELTGLPNLDAVVDPGRIERLAQAAHSMGLALAADAPLRFKAAAVEYARRATARLEDPETL